jgi:hypothetical protein
MGIYISHSNELLCQAFLKMSQNNQNISTSFPGAFNLFFV